MKGKSSHPLLQDFKALRKEFWGRHLWARGYFVATTGSVRLAAVVQHLHVLEESGVIRTEKVGRVRTCRIEPAGLSAAEQWIAERRALWERRLDRLGDFLAEQDNPEKERKKKP